MWLERKCQEVEKLGVGVEGEIGQRNGRERGVKRCKASKQTRWEGGGG